MLFRSGPRDCGVAHTAIPQFEELVKTPLQASAHRADGGIRGVSAGDPYSPTARRSPTSRRAGVGSRPFPAEHQRAGHRVADKGRQSDPPRRPLAETRPRVELGPPHAQADARAALFQEALVVAHHQLGLELFHRVEGYADDDQDRGAAEVEGGAGLVDQECR